MCAIMFSDYFNCVQPCKKKKKKKKTNQPTNQPTNQTNKNHYPPGKHHASHF